MCEHKEHKPRTFTTQAGLTRHNTMFRNLQLDERIKPRGIPLPEEATYDPNQPVPEVLDRGTPGASHVIGIAHMLDEPPVVPFGPPAPPSDRGAHVKVRDGNLYVDGQLADPDEFINGLRMAIKLT